MVSLPRNVQKKTIMKYLLPLFVLLPSFCFSQTIDTTAINQQVDSLIRVGRNHIEENEYEKADTLYQEALAIQEKVLGKEHPDYANSLHSLGILYREMANYEKAEIFLLEALTIREKVLGKEHPEYAVNLHNLGILYREMRNFEKAEPLWQEALAIQEKVLGKEHPDYANSLHSFGLLYQVMGNYEKAESLLLEALTIREKVLGKEHPDYADSLQSLGSLYEELGNYEKAEIFLLEALTIREKTQGKEHPDYANNLNSFGLVYHYTGQYEKAEPLWLEALAIRGKVLGKEHPSYAQSLNNLATLYYYIGQYEKAESFLLEALVIREKVLGKEHTRYALSLNNLGIIYQGLGNYEKAESFLLESLAIREKVLGKEHRSYANNLNSLGSFYYNTGQYEKAQPLWLEGLAIKEKVLGKEHPAYAASLHNLGKLYSTMGQYEKAKLFWQQALEILEKALGKEHPDYALSLSALGVLFQELRNYEKAELILLEVLAIREKVLGEEHSDYAATLYELGLLYVNMGDEEKAEAFFQKWFGHLKARIEVEFSYMSEQQKAAFIRNKVQKDIAQFQSATYLIQRPTLQNLQYQVALLMKGIRLQADKNTLEYILQQKEPEALEYFRQLLGVRRRLARQYERPVEKREQLDQLKAQEETLEKNLARLSATYRQQSATAKLSYQEVKAALKAGEAAIEFVHFNFYDHKTATDSTLYAAVVLRPETAHAVLVPLFAAQQLDALLSGSGGRRLDYVDQLYTFSDRGVVRRNEEERRPSLQELIWQPIDSLLEGVQTIYYSPTGLLHRLNLGAIPLDEETNLADKYGLFALTSTRRLATQQAEDSSSNPFALLFGGLRFDYDSLSIAEALIPLDSVLPEQNELLAFASLDRSLRGESWQYLKWTVREAEAVQQLLEQNGFTTRVYIS